MPPPLVVHKDESVWRWTCRAPSCCRSDWRGRHHEALQDGHRHLAEHTRFGFTPRCGKAG